MLKVRSMRMGLLVILTFLLVMTGVPSRSRRWIISHCVRMREKPSKTSISHTHSAPRSFHKTPKRAETQIPHNRNRKTLRTRWHATYYLSSKRAGRSMLPDPTKRNINPLLFQTGIRTVKKVVLTLAIHHKNVTMAKVARASITVRTGLVALCTQLSQTAAHHRSANQRAKATPDKDSSSQELERPPEHYQGFIRGAIAFHAPASSGQHRSPLCGPIAGAMSTTHTNKNMRNLWGTRPTLCGTIPFEPN